MLRHLRSWRARHGGNPIFWAKTVQIALLCVVTLVMVGATKSRFDRLGHQMMCTCGCGQILLECNHVGCPDSSRMINELHTQLDLGGGDTPVLNWFVGKYGPTVLASPIRGGFDNAAWIVPIAVFLLATAGTFVVVWFWKRRSGGGPRSGGTPVLAGGGTLEEVALRERIRRETEY
jgi:cytochrome c-type biogenesis protein CcmH/NrfF